MDARRVWAYRHLEKTGLRARSVPRRCSSSPIRILLPGLIYPSPEREGQLHPGLGIAHLAYGWAGDGFQGGKEHSGCNLSLSRAGVRSSLDRSGHPNSWVRRIVGRAGGHARQLPPPSGSWRAVATAEHQKRTTPATSASCPSGTASRATRTNKSLWRHSPGRAHPLERVGPPAGGYASSLLNNRRLRPVTQGISG